MKVRTTITLSDNLLARIDDLAGKDGNRSGVIERLLRGAMRRIEKRRAYREQVEALNRYADLMGDELLDILEYQADPFAAEEAEDLVGDEP